MVVTYFVIMLFILLLFSVYILNSLSLYMYNQARVEAMTKANIAAGNLSTLELAKISSAIDEIISELNIDKDFRLQILDAEAKVIYDNNFNAFANQTGITRLDAMIIGTLNGKNNYEKVEGNNDFLSVSVPIIKESTVKGAVYLEMPTASIEDVLRDFRNNLLMLSIILSLAIGFASFMLARMVTAPIERLRNNIKAISDSKLKQKVDVVAKGEIGDLVDAFNMIINELKVLEEKRTEFVSNASHELKTPLSSIKLICDSLLEAQQDDPQMIKEFLSDMNNEVDRLTRIINDLLDLTRMDATHGDMRDLFVTASLKDIVSGVISSLRKISEKREVSISFETNNDVFMLMDEDKVWEAIYNVVDNAIKYSSPGGNVLIYLEKDNSEAIITIKDEGIGMDKDEVHNIFDRFYRIDKARSRDTGGTGLGLSIALSAVELHGGHIEVQSNEGQGSTFRIFLPIA